MNVRVAIRERPQAMRIAAALGLVYVVWGSTYLAIRVAVETLPPMTMSGVRFVIAGLILYAFTRHRAGARPTTTQWRSAAIIGGALLVGGNGLVVLAEDRGVPSGIVALLVGTVPLWIAVIGRLVYKDRLSSRAVCGVLVGFAGVAILAKPSGAFSLVGSLMVIGAALSWACGSLYARRAPLPRSVFLATAMEMIAGGLLQLLTGALRGEWAHIHPAAFSRSSVIAMIYLIAVGSLVGFTAYIWALHHAPTSLVSTYAFVNPVIAVILGATFVHEKFSARDMVAGALIIAAVALIILARPPIPEASPADAPPGS